MLITAHGSPSDDYRHSLSMIEFACDCHPTIVCGSGDRTGLHGIRSPFRPVYRLHSWQHPELATGLYILDGDRLVGEIHEEDD